MSETTKIDVSSQQGPIRIAFESLGGAAWTGGSVYLSNLFGAITASGLPAHTILLDRSEAPSAADVTSAASEVIHISDNIYRQSNLGRVYRRVARRVGLPTSIGNPLNSTLLSSHASVFFSAVNWGPNLKVPWIGWIPDFQHVHLPGMFTRGELQTRDTDFGSIAKNADIVVLSSADALKDFRAFAPDQAHKGKVLSFVARIPQEVYTDPIKPTLERYHLPEKFFYMPNQLWKHKNIETLIDAIALLNRSGLKVNVVRTGNTNDHRNPGYASDVLIKIAEAGVHEQIIMLGMVPRAAVFTFTRQAVAVLQPSRFEGWSTSVEECKSLGKRMILSDLPVHREQNPAKSVYFPVDSAEALASAMREFWETIPPGPDLQMETEARAAFGERLAGFGKSFVSIAASVSRPV